MNSKRMPAELLNELLESLPLKNAFGFLAKMPNGLLAKNVQKMINCIKMAMKENKLNMENCGSNLTISEGGLVAKHSGPTEWNSIRTILPIPTFTLNAINKPTILFYFEIEILNKSDWANIGIGFCDQQFPLQGKWLGNWNNSIGIYYKDGMWINGSWTKIRNDSGYIKKGDFVGLGIIHHSNLQMECFATWNGQLLDDLLKLQSKIWRYINEVEKRQNSATPYNKGLIQQLLGQTNMATTLKFCLSAFIIFLGYAFYYILARLNELQLKANEMQMEVNELQMEASINNFAARKENKWNLQDCHWRLAIEKDELTLTNSSIGYSTVRAAIPAPKLFPVGDGQNKKYIVGYFEAKILKRGYDVIIGFCDKKHPLDQDIGRFRNSIGIRIQGEIEIERATTNYDLLPAKIEWFKEGDVIGIGLIYCVDRKLRCFVTRNGTLLGSTILPSHFANIKLFPAASFYLNGTSIKANFGKEKWSFDPAQLVYVK